MIVITHVSSHTFHDAGVYVITLPLILQLHLLPFVFTVAINDPFPHSHSAALLRVFQSPVLAVFHTLSLNVKSLAVGATSITFHVAVWLVTFPKLSLTYAILFPLHGCVPPVLNVHVVVLFHILLSKLYGLVCAVAHHT